MFAKLFEDEELGQILLTKHTTPHPEVPEETCPAINIQISSEDGARFGIVLPFPPSKEGFESRNRMFEEFSEEDAVKAAQDIVDEILEMAEQESLNEESDGRTD